MAHTGRNDFGKSRINENAPPISPADNPIGNTLFLDGKILRPKKDVGASATQNIE